MLEKGKEVLLVAAFFKALSQITDPRLRRVILRSVSMAIVVYTLLWAGLSWLLASTTVLSFGWAKTLLDVVGSLVIFALSMLFFPASVSIFIGLFLEETADAVEARHYLDLPPRRHQPMGEMIREGLRYASVLILANLLVLPLYVMAPFLNLLVFFVMNGYLLGREYYELVALRRLRDVEAQALWVSQKGVLWIAGCIIAGLLAVPGVNILAPLIATAFMVHVFEGLRRRRIELFPP